MQELTFDQLIEATRMLPPEQRQALAHLLQLGAPLPPAGDALAEPEVLSEAGAFSVFAPLHDVHLHGAEITDADLVAAAQCISCEWEEEPL